MGQHSQPQIKKINFSLVIHKFKKKCLPTLQEIKLLKGKNHKHAK